MLEATSPTLTSLHDDVLSLVELNLSQREALNLSLTARRSLRSLTTVSPHWWWKVMDSGEERTIHPTPEVGEQARDLSNSPLYCDKTVAELDDLLSRLSGKNELAW